MTPPPPRRDRHGEFSYEQLGVLLPKARDPSFEECRVLEYEWSRARGKDVENPDVFVRLDDPAVIGFILGEISDDD